MRTTIAVLLSVTACLAQPLQVELRFDATTVVEWPNTSHRIDIDWYKVGESRCAVDAVCVWEGEVKVHLAVEPAGAERREIILTRQNDQDERATGEIDGYRIRVGEVTPLPRLDVIPESSDYRALLIVTPPGTDMPPASTAIRATGWAELKGEAREEGR
jgi:hypothetical protein